jgi:hypothetical protein
MPIPEWLETASSIGPDTSPGLLAFRIGAALLLGVAVAGLYRWARRGEPVQATFLTTLVLLATVIAMATQVIGDNVARAFSLVGALSVVRFRTVVKDTQDTAFVIFAVVVGMASGADHLAVALVGLGIVGVASLALWPRRRTGEWQGSECTLTLRVALAGGIQASADQVLAAATARRILVSAATARQGVALDLVYRVRLRTGSTPLALVAELNMLEGVESVDLRRVD